MKFDEKTLIALFTPSLTLQVLSIYHRVIMYKLHFGSLIAITGPATDDLEPTTSDAINNRPAVWEILDVSDL